MMDGGYGVGGDVLPTWLELEPPRARSLQVYALDPNVGSYVNNRITIEVPWEPLLPGPAGAKIAVVDYDAGNDCYYPPVDLEHPLLLARQGLSVLVVEARDVVGGAAVSEHPFGPDYTVTSLSYVVSLLPASIVSALDLAAHGYHVYAQGPPTSPPGATAATWPCRMTPGRAASSSPRSPPRTPTPTPSGNGTWAGSGRSSVRCSATSPRGSARAVPAICPLRRCCCAGSRASTSGRRSTA